METMDRYIRFDWAIKRLLRQKANFGVLEGLLTVLLNEEVKIVEILESENNQLTADDKFNRATSRRRTAKEKSSLWKYKTLVNCIISNASFMEWRKQLPSISHSENAIMK